MTPEDTESKVCHQLKHVTHKLQNSSGRQLTWRWVLLESHHRQLATQIGQDGGKCRVTVEQPLHLS